MVKLPDVQKSADGFYNKRIDKVGVRNIKVPFQLVTKKGKCFNTIATISSYCNLVPNLKGINMSRISRTINDILNSNESGFKNLNEFVYELQKNHGTDNIWIKAYMEYLMKDISPIDQLLCNEPVSIIFESKLQNNICRNFVTVKTNQMSCCPCSKEMSLLTNNLTEHELEELESKQLSDGLMQKIKLSGFGAHNQRSEIEITVELLQDNIFVEDLVNISRLASSCATFSTLKRPDEKFVTEASYMGKFINENYEVQDTNKNDGPKFVEDIARECAQQLDEWLDNKINDYVVVVNNQESIHSDEIMATAVLTAGRKLI